MTPNKLPPLPETWYVMKDEETPAFDAEHMKSYAAEALRQSQSLPAGAVAGLVGMWRDEVEVVRKNYERSSVKDHSEVAVTAMLACAKELEQALQADAREKGEAVVSEAVLDRAVEAFDDVYEAEYRLAGLHSDNKRTAIRAAILATQPAQASEKDVMRLFCEEQYEAFARFRTSLATSSQETASE